MLGLDAYLTGAQTVAAVENTGQLSVFVAKSVDVGGVAQFSFLIAGY